MTDILNSPLWSEDHTYPLNITLNRALPNPHTVTDQRAWDACAENRVRLLISRLCCEETCFAEGVKVKRTDAPAKQSFNVNNDMTISGVCFKRYNLDEAVARSLGCQCS